MATGDLKNNIRCLQSKLKIANYPKDIDMKSISKGLPQEYLPLMHYFLLEFSRPVAQHIVNNDVELYGKSDEKFMVAAYKVFRDIFHYKPSITRQQFFSRGFAEHKIIMVVDLIRMVKDKHKQLSKNTSTGRLKKVAGSLGRLQSTPGKEQVSSVRMTLPDSDQLVSPDLLMTEASSVTTPTLFNTSEPKTTALDTGYHTAETSPTLNTQEEDTKKATVSVNDLRAKFETSGLVAKHDSFDSKVSDTDLEEHPVIRALIKQIVHLDEQLTATNEALKAKVKEDEERHSTMQARMVLMQTRLTILESKVSPEPVEEKPVRQPLAQGAAQDVPLALLRPNQRRPENIPLPESPIIPSTPSQTPSSAQTPPPQLSISAVVQDHESPPTADTGSTQYKRGGNGGDHYDGDDEDQPVRDVSFQRYHGHSGQELVAKPPVSVVGPLQSYLTPTAETADPQILTIQGVSSPTPMDMAWAHPSSSTPIETAFSGTDAVRRNSASSEDGPRGLPSNDDDIDEGLVDVDDNDLGEYIVETARDISADISSADNQDNVEMEMLETEQDAGGELNPSVNIPNQLQRLQDMLVNTRMMLSIDSSPTPEPPKEE